MISLAERRAQLRAGPPLRAPRTSGPRPRDQLVPPPATSVYINYWYCMVRLMPDALEKAVVNLGLLAFNCHD